tara:strand:- start:13885 stop:14073 length:189 start_codon:yes stop_codon:yes gene_type:complete
MTKPDYGEFKLEDYCEHCENATQRAHGCIYCDATMAADHYHDRQQQTHREQQRQAQENGETT